MRKSLCILFALTLAVFARAQDDHSSDPDTATVISTPSTTDGHIEVGEDTDAFRLTVSEGAVYDISVELGTLSDSILSIRTASNEILISNDDRDPGVDLSSKVTWEATLGGDVFVVVESFGGATGTYRLIARRDIGIVGDLNDDSTVDLRDVEALKDFLLQRSSLDGDLRLRADVNQDGAINVADILAMGPFLPPPTIVSVDPERGSTVTSLTEITITFDRPVPSLEPGDLIVFGDPATSLRGSNPYTFGGFDSPPAGASAFIEIFGDGFVEDLWEYTIFAEYTVTYRAGPNGALQGDATQTVGVGESTTPVTAVPDDGFRFSRWSDGSTDNPRVDLDVNSTFSVTAEFEETPDPGIEFIAIAASTFPMGDFFNDGFEAAQPVINVTLSAYHIGRYEVTNAQFIAVYNWALENGRAASNPAGIFAFGEQLVDLADAGQPLSLSGNALAIQPREGRPMEDHPVIFVSWYGAVAYCNWRSEIEGLDPVYSTTDFSANFNNNGYHLPTEAQWERAASWDANDDIKYRYGYGENDIDPNFTQVNTTLQDFVGAGNVANPLGFTSNPFTTPVGWFDGVNISPNGNVRTTDAASPTGAYDMSGNVDEWVHDLFFGSYYEVSPRTDPTGPDVGDVDPIFGNEFVQRVTRGGSWAEDELDINTASRGVTTPTLMVDFIGFRIAR